VLREIEFLLKNYWLIQTLHLVWKLVTWIQICASLNQRKKMKAEPSRLVPRKLAANLKLLIVSF